MQDNSLSHETRLKELENACADLEKRIGEGYKSLGEEYFSKHADEVSRVFPDRFGALSNDLNRLTQLRDKIAYLMSSAVCQACGTELKKGALYCPMCGKRTAENAPENACPHCGSPIETGCVFCTRCGKKLSDADTTPAPKENVRDLPCPRCGRLLRRDAKFCSGCGHKLI